MTKMINTDDRRKSYPDMTVVAVAPEPNDFGFIWSMLGHEDESGRWMSYIAIQTAPGHYRRHNDLPCRQYDNFEACKANAINMGYVLAD